MDIYTKTIRDVMSQSVWASHYDVVGKNAFIRLINGNNIKITVQKYGILCQAINRTSGVIDKTELPYSEYFIEKQCSPNAPKWHQFIDGNNWWFAGYAHCLPTESDFRSIANGVDEYVDLFNG